MSTCQKNENVADIVEGAYPEEVADAVVFLAPIKLPSLKDKLLVLMAEAQCNKSNLNQCATSYQGETPTAGQVN